MKKVIISDIDGTLALIGDRDPFNPETVENDILNNAVANILHVYAAQREVPVEIILLTGRFERYRGQTETWLLKHGIENHHLYMRPDNDRRPDILFKKDIYHRHIAGRYEVLFILEDRDRIVSMWRRELGLTCLQVEYGNF